VARFTTRPELTGTFGMIAATHWLAAQSGMRILEAGGNAFDAAATAGFVLEVVEPHQNGLGGEAPMIGYSADEDDVFVVCGQGPAPAGATAAALRALGLDLVPGSGLLAACVPAAFGSWMLLLERYGTLPLRDILSPAIWYARDGFPALPSLAAVLERVAPMFRDRWPSSAALWAQDGVPKPGERVRNPQLAATFQALLEAAESAGPERVRQIEAARRAYYEGFVAEAIGAFAAEPLPDLDGTHAGLLTVDDLAGWRAGIERPERLAYRDFEVFKTPTWGQGPVMLQQLALLRGIDVAGLGEGSAELIHVMTECAKLAFADREAWYGDPAVGDVPLVTLLSADYNDRRRQLIGDEASIEFRPGSPDARTPRLPSLPFDRSLARSPAVPDAEAAGLGDPTGAGADGRGDTVHVDVADRFGNIISCTPSGGWLQSSPAIPGLGFCLGTRAQMFWLEDGLASTLRPRSRPRTTLSPSLAFRDGKPYLAFGTPGGDQQDQWPLRVLVYHADFDLPLQAAVDAASWHSNHFPSSFHPREYHPAELEVESRLGSQVIEELRRRGHRVVEAPDWALGRCTAVARTPDGLLHAAADPRTQQAYAVGR
jgi:gamma-glutamyltranspeptidase/glutathione hydrolase